MARYGTASLGIVSASPGMARHGIPGRSVVQHPWTWHGMASLGSSMAQHGITGHGSVQHCWAWLGTASLCSSEAQRGIPGHGSARLSIPVHGLIWHPWAVAWHSTASLAWLGTARHPWAWVSVARHPWALVWNSAATQGMAQ